MKKIDQRKVQLSFIMTRTFSAGKMAGWKSKMTTLLLWNANFGEMRDQVHFNRSRLCWKSDKMWCPYLLITCISLRSFWMTLVYFACTHTHTAVFVTVKQVSLYCQASALPVKNWRILCFSAHMPLLTAISKVELELSLVVLPTLFPYFNLYLTWWKFCLLFQEANCSPMVR